MQTILILNLTTTGKRSPQMSLRENESYDTIGAMALKGIIYWEAVQLAKCLTELLYSKYSEIWI